VPVVRAGGREAEGVPVPVECVADLHARAGRALAAEALPGLDAAAARARLERLLRAGLRAPEAAGATPLIAALEDPAAPAWRAASLGEDAWLFGGFPGERRAGALVLLWSEGEDEDLPLAGPVGDAWRALARERGLGLFVLRAGAGDGASLRRGLEEVARLAGADPLLVARGRTALISSLAFAAAAADGPLPLSGLVLLSPAPGVPRLLPPAPTLVVAPGTAPGDPPRDVRVVAGGALPFLDEPRLPALVAEWLGR
jgi:hypothetical protein